MKKNIIFILFYFMFALFVFKAGAYAAVINEGVTIDENIDPNENSYVDLENENGIMSLSLSSLNDNIHTINVYVDDNNILKAMLIKCNNSYYSDDLYVRINDTDIILASPPESNGYIYKSFDSDLVIEGSAEILFYNEEEETNKETISPIKIVTSDDKWTVSENGHSLYLYKGTSENVIVPNFYNNKIITMVGGYTENGSYQNLMYGNSNSQAMSNVEISEGIRAVNHFAFESLSQLKGVSLPNSLEIIGAAAFAYTSLTGSLYLPNKLTDIYSYAFMNCNKLTGDITIPSGVRTVNYAAFYNCTALKGDLIFENGVEELGTLSFSSAGFKSIMLPDTIKKIGPFAFQFCSNVTTISLPEGLETISDGAFNHMTGLTDTKMIIPSTVNTIGGDYEVENNTGYGCHIFYDMGKNETFTEFEVAEENKYFTALDGVLYTKDMKRMIAYPRGKRDTVFEIPEGVAQLDEMAFSRAYYLNKVILPDSLIITDKVPENVLNQLGNNLAVAIYCYTSINEIAVKDTNPNYITIDGMLYSKDMESLWYIPNKYSGNVIIADGAKRIEQGAVFISNKANTGWNSIHIPSSMEYISNIMLEVINEYFKGYISVDTGRYYKLNDESGIIIKITDVNQDGIINSADAALILKFISGISVDDNIFDERAADCNDDNLINMIDAVIVLNNK